MVGTEEVFFVKKNKNVSRERDVGQWDKSI